MAKPGKLRDYTGKFPDEDTIRLTYKLEPLGSPKELQEEGEKRRVYALNVAMSKISLEDWDAWISHLVEYDFWPNTRWLKAPYGVHFCLFCHVTDMSCMLCSGTGRMACTEHETTDDLWVGSGKPTYNRMVEVGIEKIQSHADWLQHERNGNGNN